MYRFNNSIYSKKLCIQRLIIDKSVRLIERLLPDFKYYHHILRRNDSNFPRILSVMLHKHCLLDNNDFIGDTTYKWRDLFVFLDCTAVKWYNVIYARPVTVHNSLRIRNMIAGYHSSLFKLAALVFLDRTLTIDLFKYFINLDAIDNNMRIFITLLYNMCSTSGIHPRVEKLFTSEEQISLFYAPMLTVSTITKLINRSDVLANSLLNWIFEYGIYIPKWATYIDLNYVGEIELTLDKVFRVLRVPHEYKSEYRDLDEDIRDWLLGNANTKDYNTLMYIRLSEFARDNRRITSKDADRLIKEIMDLFPTPNFDLHVVSVISGYIDVDLLQPLLPL